MGVEIGALVESARMPSRELWQGAIDALGLPVRLPDPFDPAASGNQTFSLDGEPVSVEVDLVDAGGPAGWDEVRRNLGRSRRRRLDGRDTFVSFRWGSELAAAACASAAVAGLAVVAAGLVWDLESDELLGATWAVDLARACAAAAEHDHAEPPLRAREAASLWRTHLVPALEEATGLPVVVRGWTVVVGPVGWFARLIVFTRTSATGDRTVRPRVLLPQLYSFAPPLSITPTGLGIGGERAGPDTDLHIPAAPGPAHDEVMVELTRRIVDEAVPHLARYPDLASLAAANRASLGTTGSPYPLDELAGALLILGDDDRAIATYELLADHVDDRARADGGLDELPEWMLRLRQRALDLPVLIRTDRSAALARLAEQARTHAADAGIGEPLL